MRSGAGCTEEGRGVQAGPRPCSQRPAGSQHQRTPSTRQVIIEIANAPHLGGPSCPWVALWRPACSAVMCCHRTPPPRPPSASRRLLRSLRGGVPCSARPPNSGQDQLPRLRCLSQRDSVEPAVPDGGDFPGRERRALTHSGARLTARPARLKEAALAQASAPGPCLSPPAGGPQWGRGL